VEELGVNPRKWLWFLLGFPSFVHNVATFPVFVKCIGSLIALKFHIQTTLWMDMQEEK
jgi:hypothetical protein